MYKVGDEVLVKAKIEEIDKDGDFRVKAVGCCSQWVKENIITDKTYEQGLADAWELAKKLFAEYKESELDEIFGKGWSFPKFMEFTPEEALAKIEAYEKENEFKLGDEVVHDCEGRKTKFYVTYLTHNQIKGFSKDGDTHYFVLPNRYIKKTRKHIDIESLLRQMGE